jgi:hypothetical protein
MLAALHDRGHRIVITSARPAEAEALTEQWLERNGLEHDALQPSREARKSEHGADVLIDDYTGNIVGFMENTSKWGILVDQPWNRLERDSLTEWLDQRLWIVTSLAQVVPIIDRINH